MHDAKAFFVILFLVGRLEGRTAFRVVVRCDLGSASLQDLHNLGVEAPDESPGPRGL